MTVSFSIVRKTFNGSFRFAFIFAQTGTKTGNKKKMSKRASVSFMVFYLQWSRHKKKTAIVGFKIRLKLIECKKKKTVGKSVIKFVDKNEWKKSAITLTYEIIPFFKSNFIQYFVSV